MAKAVLEIRSLARSHTVSALKVLAGIMTKEDAPEAARVAASRELLDRGWGKATQPVSGEDGGAILHRIERIIVRDPDTDS